MGADFIVDYTYWKAKKGENPMDGFRRHVGDITTNIAALRHIPAGLEEALGELPKTIGEAKQILSDYLDTVAVAAAGERTATIIQMGPYFGLITGGESYGDAPSDAYTALGILHAAGVIDLPK